MTPHLDSQIAAVELAWSMPDGHRPNDAERAVLSGFMGWGGLAKAFELTAQGQWARAADRLEVAVPTAALSAARDQVDTSFFTPSMVTGAVWEILTAAGFSGGRILEPGCGTGAFMGSSPSAVDVAWTGVEIDPTSARIARLLHPDAEILEGALEKTPLREGFYDAAIGNVPFSSVTVGDREGRAAALHNYFAWRAVDAVRPGGYVVLVTSRHAMDAQGGVLRAIRDWDGAALVGAVRLPSGAFAEAGTQAVTDIIVVRKNDAAVHLPSYAGQPDFEVIDRGWDVYTRRVNRETVDHRTEITERINNAPEGASVRVSQYWADNPAHVAGRMLATGFDRAPLVVASDAPAEDVARAVRALTASLVSMGKRNAPDLSDVVLHDAEGRKEGSFHLVEGAMHRVDGGRLVPVRTSQELVALVGLRDLARELLDLESDTSLPDAAITASRARTRDAYEAYVRRFGHLNRGTLVEGRVDEETGLPALSWRRPSMGGFRRDPDSALVMALEVFDQDTGEAQAAPILVRRVNRAPRAAETADTPAEALAISLGETGQVDMSRIAGLLGMSPAEAETALGDLVFLIDGAHVPASVALSGNVRAKLSAARAAAHGGAEGAARYVSALEKVLPKELGPADINLTLGTPFVTADDMTRFVREVLGVRWGTVTHTPSQAVWEVFGGGGDYSLRLQWGIPEMEPAQLLECGLNNQSPEIADRVWDSERRDWRRVKNPQKSAAAAAKLELIRDRFSVWVWEDAERAERVCLAYNTALNSHVPRAYDGSGLTFPGMSESFVPWNHQRAAVERIVSSERVLIGHPVGAGKTASAIMGARTLRQFGLAHKPMIVVPNHLLEQISREAAQLFPTAKILIAGKDDLARDARRLFAARCATGDWDAVIITHQSFGSIPLRPEVEERWLQEQMHQLRWAMMSEPDTKSKGAKAIARAVRSLGARLQKLRDGKNDPDMIFFDQLGVDYIMVDECHLFRRLDTQSTARDSGLGSGTSKRATDLLMKVESLAERRPGMPVCAFFTGTPWSNTLAETWVWQRFLQPDDLESIGLLPFDAWVSAFIRYENNIEVAPDGSGFRMYRRPVGVVNAPELKTILSGVADIMDPEELGLTRPDHTTVNVTVEATPRQREFVSDLADRADAIRSGVAREIDGRDVVDNMLLICNDGRKIALDPILAGIDEPSVKIAKAADLIAAAYHEGKHRMFGANSTPGAFQLVFMDLGTPHPDDAQSYGRLRRGLVDRGVPARKVRFVHEAKTDKARAALFASCRNGEVSVLVASTMKAGMGTNIQTRLSHLWHVDAPWLPSEVIQRDGRAIRPGNLAGHVTITRLVTEGTFDAYMWQALERKSRSFDALYATGATAREVEDISGATMSYGEVKALASGNPLLLDQAKVRAEVKQLQTLRAMHLQGMNKAQHATETLTQKAQGFDKLSGHLAKALEVVTPAPDDSGKIVAELSSRVDSFWLQGEDKYPLRLLDYRGITICFESFRRDETAAVASLLVGYSSFAEMLTERKRLRGGPLSVAQSLLERVDAILDALQSRISQARNDRDYYLGEAEQARSAAEGAVFDQQAALEDALVRLAEIDAAISADAAAPAAAA